MKMLNKKGISLIMAEIAYIILLIIIFLPLFYKVGIAGSSDSDYEQMYAKKISLIIEEARPNTHIELNINELLNRADKNKYTGDIVSIDKNSVLVKVSEKGGYGFSYLSNANIGKIENRENGLLILDIKT